MLLHLLLPSKLLISETDQLRSEGKRSEMDGPPTLLTEKPGDRAARKADKIRDRLGWEAGILNGAEPWNRPKGMHWRTYERLCREHDALLDRALVGIMDHLNRLSGRF